MGKRKSCWYSGSGSVTDVLIVKTLFMAFQNHGWKNTGSKKAGRKFMANSKDKLIFRKLSTKNIFHNESVLKNMS